MSSNALFERFRPRSLDEVVGQSKAVLAARRLLADGIGGKAVMLTGPSGSGKTTIARILAESIATAPHWVVEGDSSYFSAAELDRIRYDVWRMYGGGKGGRVWIINECHGLRSDQIRRLLVMLEEIPNHCAFIFTTTNDGADKLFDDQIDAGPLTSRCIQIALTNQGTASAFAARLHEIALAAGMNGCANGETKALSIVRSVKGNMRAALQAVAAGAMMAEVGEA